MTGPITDPAWQAAHNGFPGDSTAVNHAAQVGQFLATHGIIPVYAGNQIVTPAGNGAFEWMPLSADDVDQPFTLPGGSTTVGRVLVPLLPSGSGADLTVSLCADSAGSPGTVLASTVIPAAHITQFSAPDGLDGSPGPLATAAFNALFFTGWTSVPWSPPATSATGGLDTARVGQGGSYLVFAGGVDAASGKSTATVVTLPWSGGTVIGTTTPQAPLPQPLLAGSLALTADTIVYAGGVNTSGASPSVQSTVYTASWDPDTGTIGAWSAQPSLPAVRVDAGAAAHLPSGTVFIAGGSSNYASETAFVTSVYYAAVANQQITAWGSGPPLPIPLAAPTCAVIGNWLIVAGGYTTGAVQSTALYYAPVDPVTGIPGSWSPGPSFPAAVSVESPTAISGAGLAWPQAISVSTGLSTQDTFTLTFDENGPGVLVRQACPLTVLNQDPATAMTDLGNGSSQLFNFLDSTYLTVSVVSVPVISVPLPASGLTGGGTYHVLLQQQVGDLNNYLSVGLDASALPGNGQYRARGTSGAWTALTGFSVPVSVCDRTPAGSPLHLWEDSGARVTTLVNASSSGLFLGAAESTAFPSGSPANMLAAVTQVVYNSAGLPAGTVQLA